MVSKLLSTTFSANALNDAVVKQRATDRRQGEEISTRSSVSVGGFWGWLGYRAHAASTLDQQQALFKQLARELREHYLGDTIVPYPTYESATALNAHINRAENLGRFSGTDRETQRLDVVKLATVHRLQAEVKRLASQKGAFLTPRMIAEIKTKAEIQFASIAMSGMKGYQPRSTGGRISEDQNFNPLKDYKALLKQSQGAAEVIRLSADGKILNSEGQWELESEISPAQLILASGDSGPADPQVAEKTLAHCLASLKQAYFRTDTDAALLSTKEVAFDRLVSKYVESRMIDKATGRLGDLTARDFRVLEAMAFANRSTIGRVERPFDEIFGSAPGTTPHSRYSGFTLGKDVGVVHLISEPGRHAAMYIEALDPETQAWQLTKLDFVTTPASSSFGRTVLDRLRDDTLMPGEIRLAEGSVIPDPEDSNGYAVTHPEVIAEADLRIGRALPAKAQGLFTSGHSQDVTSARLPLAVIKKIIETAKVQHDEQHSGKLQGNVPMYHMGGRNASMEDLREELKAYKHKQETAMLELARIQMLFDQFSALNLDSNEAAVTAVERSWLGVKTTPLLRALRDKGLFDPISSETLQGSPANTSTRIDQDSLRKRFIALREAYSAASDAPEKQKEIQSSIIGNIQRFGPSAMRMLRGGDGLSNSEHAQLSKMFGFEMNALFSDLWQYQRGIHQLTQKIENLTTIEILESDLKAVRNELQARETLRSKVDEAWNVESRKLSAAMRTLKPQGWTEPLSFDALQNYCKTGQFEDVFTRFAHAAIGEEKATLMSQRGAVQSQNEHQIDAEAEQNIFHALQPLAMAHLNAYESWKSARSTDSRANEYNEDLDRIRAATFGSASNAPTPVSDKELADLEAALELRYNALSADMIRGADGYTATDEKGRRAVRAMNCADWVRTMMRLGGVNIEGIQYGPSSLLPGRFNPSDPLVLARGHYDSFRIGDARKGFRSHGQARPTVNLSPQQRAALANPGAFLMQQRRHGVQFDAIPQA